MLHMIENFAVILTGHPRTWNFCKEYILKFVDDCFGKNVDWFICLEQSTTVDKNQITDFFSKNSQNLVYLNFVNKENNAAWNNNNWNNSFFKNVHYSRYVSGFNKRLHEFKTGKIYHKIFFARPDCIYLYNKDYKFIENNNFNLKNFSFHLGGDFDDTSMNYLSPSGNDLVTIAGMISSDLISNWYLDNNFKKNNIDQLKIRLGTDIHSGLSMYCKNHLITVPDRYIFGNVKRSVMAEVVRPTHIIYKSNSFSYMIENFDKIDFSNQYIINCQPGVCEYWNHLTNSKEYKINSCLQLGIDLKDYNLQK